MSQLAEEVEIVERMRGAMLKKLRANSHKSHWRDESCEYLLTRLREEVDELEKAIGCTPAHVLKEAADVANFAAMIADVQR